MAGDKLSVSCATDEGAFRGPLDLPFPTLNCLRKKEPVHV